MENRYFISQLKIMNFNTDTNSTDQGYVIFVHVPVTDNQMEKYLYYIFPLQFLKWEIKY